MAQLVLLAPGSAMPAKHLIELPADVLGLILFHLPLAHDIAAVAPTSRVLCNAAKLALKLRPFSGEVVTLAGHAHHVNCVAVVPDGPRAGAILLLSDEAQGGLFMLRR